MRCPYLARGDVVASFQGYHVKEKEEDGNSKGITSTPETPLHLGRKTLSLRKTSPRCRTQFLTPLAGHFCTQ